MLTKDGRLHIISGASRSGKTVLAARMAKAFEVCFVWDVEAQWCAQKGFKRVKSKAHLVEIVKKGTRGRWCYVPSGQDLKADFEFFAQCCFHYGSYFGECAVVAEELADVTTVSKAGQWWGICLRRGLKRAMTFFCISQRWAEADKTAIGNATDFWLFRMATDTDVRYMATKTRVVLERLQSLKPLDYVHYNALTGQVEQKKLTF